VLDENECALRLPLANIAEMFGQEIERILQEMYGQSYINIHFPDNRICILVGHPGETEPCYEEDNTVSTACCMIRNPDGSCAAPAEQCDHGGRCAPEDANGDPIGTFDCRVFDESTESWEPNIDCCTQGS
jgi:hypothetical protein